MQEFPFRKLHKLKSITPKLIIFIWRLIKGALPVLQSLKERKILGEAQAICNFCKKEPETIRHLFIKCDLAKAIWESEQEERRTQWSKEEISKQIAEIITKGPEERICHIFAGLWIIWKARCNLHFRGEKPNLDRMRIERTSLIRDLQEAENWRKEGELKEERKVTEFQLFVDAAVRSDGNGWAAVLQTNKGNFVNAWAGFTYPVPSLLAECEAISQALNIIREDNLTNTSILSDCLTAVESIKSPTIGKLDQHIGDIITRIKEKAQKLNVDVQHTSREYNMAANDLAKFAMINKCNLTTHPGCIPECILHHF